MECFELTRGRDIRIKGFNGISSLPVPFYLRKTAKNSA